MKLVADINIPFLKGVLDPYFDSVVLLPANEITSEVVFDADALLVRTRTICNAHLLEGSKVKFIGTATIGFDHIDTEFCNSRGIEWVSAPGCNSGAVQQWIAAVLIHISKSKGIKLEGQTLGVVGVGNVGRKVVDVALALGMKVLCCDPPRKKEEHLSDFVDLKTIVQQSDFVTFHVPLTYQGVDSTYHLVDDSLISSLKDGAVLINSSRGEVVETQSLINAINSRRFAAVALDVWEKEPNISNDLVKLIDIATPHIAGYSLEGKVNGTIMIVDALSKFFNLNIHPWQPVANPTNEKEVVKSLDLIDTIVQTYDIKADDSNFRQSVGRFEKYRSDYALRREFSGYRVESSNDELLKVLSKLGFVTNTQ